MIQKNLGLGWLSALLLIVGLSAVLSACGDDQGDADAGPAQGSMDGSTDEGPDMDAGPDGYVWVPSGGSGGGGSSGSGGSAGSGGSGGGGGPDGRMCAEPRSYWPETFLPRCSQDTALCIAGCMSATDPDTCRDACIDADTTPAETTYGLNCGGCIYLTLFACIDMADCHDGVAEVFCCIEDNCPTGSPENCGELMCGSEIEAAVTCGYFAEPDCVDFFGDAIGRCFAGSGEEDAGR
jgi:hypothetical protein